jgi:O-phosphoseryl-tRNA(Cys) synthetase
MKRIFVIFLVAAGCAHVAKAQYTTNQKQGVSELVAGRQNVTVVSLGENLKLSALPSERNRIRLFYGDVLGCPLTKTAENADVFRLGATFYIGVIYEDSVLSDQEALRSAWLELRADHPEELKQKILNFGIKQIPHWDKEHFYFQAPGGQAYRVVGSSEDLSKWQQ